LEPVISRYVGEVFRSPEGVVVNPDYVLIGFENPHSLMSSLSSESILEQAASMRDSSCLISSGFVTRILCRICLESKPLALAMARILIDVSFLKSSNKEIKKMNIGKVGAPFQYSDSYVRFLAFLKIGFKIPYRMVQGIVRGLAEYVKIVEEIHFTHIRKRMIEIKPSIENDNDNDNEEPITLVVDASGLTISKKGDYIEEKWIRKKKEFIKLHIAADAKSKKVISFRITRC
jgi:hypothetical protein